MSDARIVVLTLASKRKQRRSSVADLGKVFARGAEQHDVQEFK